MHESLYTKAQEIREVIKKLIPNGSIVAEHTATSHHYRCHLFDGSPLLDSVTTKTGIIGESYLKNWAVNVAMDKVRQNVHRIPAETEIVLEEASRGHVDIFENAGKMGTLVHDAVEDYLNDWISAGEKPTPDKTVLSYLPEFCDVRVLSAARAAQSFIDDHYIIPVHSELLVASKKLQVGGTMDFLALMGTETHPAESGETEREYYSRKKGKDSIVLECIRSGHQIQFDLVIIDWKTSNSMNKSQYVLQVAAYNSSLEELTGLTTKSLYVARLDKQTGKYEKATIDRPKYKKALTQYKNAVGPLYDWLHSQDSNLDPDAKEVNVLKI